MASSTRTAARRGTALAVLLLVILGGGLPVRAEDRSGVIRGLLTDAAGRPVAGARVYVQAMDSMGWPILGSRRALVRAFEAPKSTRLVGQTGADGRFFFDGLTVDRSHHVQVQSEKPVGAAATSAVARAVAPPEVRIQLEPGRRLRGRLLDAEREGTKGRLAMYGERTSTSFLGGSAVSHVVLIDEATDDDGQFAVIAPATLALRIDAHVPGVGTRSVGLRPGTEDTTLEIPMRRAAGCTASGRVLDDTGAPLPGAYVQVGTRTGSEYRAEGRMVALARSDADGRWEITGLPEGWITLSTAWAPGRLVHHHLSLSIPLRKAHPWSADFVLGRAAVLTGRVLDEDGKGVAGAHVTHAVSYFGNPPLNPTTVTDTDGRYRFDTVPPLPGTLSVAAPGHVLRFEGAGTGEYQRAAFRHPPPEPGETVTLDIPVVRGKSLRGRVVDTKGRPIAGVAGALTMSVGSHVLDNYRRQDRPIWTDADGRFDVHGIAADAALSLGLRAEGYAYSTVAVHLPSDPAAPPLQFVLEPATMLRGRVLDAADRPMPGVPVGLSPNFVQATTDARGAFALEAPSAGTVRLHIGHGMHAALATLVLDVQQGVSRDDIVLRWPAGGSIGGVVLDEQGKPCASVLVGVQSETSRALSTRTWTDAEGRWRIEHAPEGRYKVSVGQQWPPATSVATGETDSRAELKAETVEIFDGVLLGPAGEPVPRGTISAARPGEASNMQRGFAHVIGGHFRIVRPRGLVGPMALTVTAARDAYDRSYGARLARVTVDTDSPQPVEIRLAPASSVAGRVVDADGKPVPGLLVTLSAKQPPPNAIRRAALNAWTDAQGRFRFGGVDPGAHYVSLMQGAGYVAPKALEVQAGAKDVVLTVARWRSIAGTVLDPDGKPAAGCTVTLGLVPRAYPRPHMRAVSTDKKGRFVIDRVQSGQPQSVTASPQPGREGDAVPGSASNIKPGAKDVVVKLQRGAWIAGLVRGIQGEPIAGCDVTTRNVKTSDGQPAPWYTRPKAITDAKGRYRLGPFQPGTAADVQFAMPRNSEDHYFAEVRPSIAAGTKSLVVRMERGLMIYGVVQGVPADLLKGFKLTASPDAPGMAPVGAQFTFDGKTSLFRIGPLRLGPHKIRPYMRSSGRLFYPASVKAVAPSKGLVIQVEQAWYVSGRVRTKNPRGYSVEFHPPEGNKLSTRVTGSDGAFRLGRVRDVHGQLFVFMRGSDRVALLEKVRPSEGPFEVELTTGRPIKGRVTNLPAKMSRGRITAKRGGVTVTGDIAEDGWFETPPLPPGSWKLSVEASRPRGGTYSAPSKVPAGAKNVLIRFRPAR